jgi:adenosylhomocysteine nucleosidase
MNILIIEDDQNKRDCLINYAHEIGVSDDDIVVAVDMADFVAKFNPSISICIIDLRLPAYSGGENNLNGLGVLQIIDKVGNGSVKLLAISAYPDEFTKTREQFERRGCLLVDYNQPEVWKSVFKQMIVQSQAVEKMDFIIFCALREERKAFTLLPDLKPTPSFRDNITRLDIVLGDRRGTVIELPRMGLVDGAVVAGTCIEKFKPTVVAMSGVCAGFKDRAELGQLLIADMAYEYQSGKWTDDGFAQEPYQVPMSEAMRSIVREILEDQDILLDLETGWRSDRPVKMTAPKPVTLTSGSAVIANDLLMEQVAKYHRRVSGLDMEVYALMRAAHLAQCKPEAICAKVVVDLADGEKNKTLQPYGSYVSARFVLLALTKFFS